MIASLSSVVPTCGTPVHTRTSAADCAWDAGAAVDRVLHHRHGMTLTATNWWLAIIAIAAVLQTGPSWSPRPSPRCRGTRRTHEIYPHAHGRRSARGPAPDVAAHRQAVDDLTERLGRAGTAVEETAEHLADTWGRVREWTTHRVWPVLGAVSAVRAAASVLRKTSKPRRASDETAEARFVYEGGAHARDVG